MSLAGHGVTSNARASSELLFALQALLLWPCSTALGKTDFGHRGIKRPACTCHAFLVVANCLKQHCRAVIGMCSLTVLPWYAQAGEVEQEAVAGNGAANSKPRGPAAAGGGGGSKGSSRSKKAEKRSNEVDSMMSLLKDLSMLSDTLVEDAKEDDELFRKEA